MALLERVATLIRANLNDLIDKVENPETMIKQVILDMENQLLQVKTQVELPSPTSTCSRRSGRRTKKTSGSGAGAPNSRSIKTTTRWRVPRWNAR